MVCVGRRWQGRGPPRCTPLGPSDAPFPGDLTRPIPAGYSGPGAQPSGGVPPGSGLGQRPPQDGPPPPKLLPWSVRWASSCPHLWDKRNYPTHAPRSILGVALRMLQNCATGPRRPPYVWVTDRSRHAMTHAAYVWDASSDMRTAASARLTRGTGIRHVFPHARSPFPWKWKAWPARGQAA